MLAAVPKYSESTEAGRSPRRSRRTSDRRRTKRTEFPNYRTGPPAAIMIAQTSEASIPRHDLFSLFSLATLDPLHFRSHFSTVTFHAPCRRLRSSGCLDAVNQKTIERKIRSDLPARNAGHGATEAARISREVERKRSGKGEMEREKGKERERERDVGGRENDRPGPPTEMKCQQQRTKPPSVFVGVDTSCPFPPARCKLRSDSVFSPRIEPPTEGFPDVDARRVIK